MSKRRRSSATRRAAAFALLGAGVLVFARAISGEFADTPPRSESLGDDDTDGELALPTDTGLPDGDQTSEVIEVDLLAIHGSWNESMPTPLGFGTPPASMVPAAPGPFDPGVLLTAQDEVEIAPLRVSLVMLSGRISRASIDGVVVGLGGRVKAGVVTRITPEGIEVRSGSQTLFYDVGGSWPRGHEPETASGEVEVSER